MDQLDRTPLFGWETHELGNDVQIKGVVIGSRDREVTLYLPGEASLVGAAFLYPTAEELQKWLLATDDPKFEEIDPSGVVKAIHRKMTRHVDQELMWETYRRDNFTCQYCGATNRALTYDHWLAQKFGGPTTLENGVTACRPCNKAKGHMTVEAWTQFMKERGFRGPKAQSA